MKISLTKEELSWLKGLVFRTWGTQFDNDDIDQVGSDRNKLAYSVYLKLKIALSKDKLDKAIKTK